MDRDRDRDKKKKEAEASFFRISNKSRFKPALN